MALAAIEHPNPVHLLADAVDLVRAAARPGPRAPDPVTVRCLRALLRDLLVSADELADELAEPLARPTPAPPTVVTDADACTDAGGGGTARPGSLHLAVVPGDEVRLAGRGPAAEGDLVRAALHQRAGATGYQSHSRAHSRAHDELGRMLWASLVAVARDGLEPPTALPTPLALVGRTRR